MSALLRTAMASFTSVSRLAGRQLVVGAPGAGPSMPRRALAVSATAKKEQLGKQALIEVVHTKLEAGGSKISKAETERAISALIDTIEETVASGSKVVIPGFGSFEPRFRAARQGRNPQTGQPLSIAASTSPAFSAGKTFKDRVKNAHSH